MKYHIEKFIDENTINNAIVKIAKTISNEFEDKPILLVGLLKGSTIFLADLARKLKNDCEIDFMSVSSYGDKTETSGEIKILKDLDVDIKDKNVIIVEDIIDTGLTLFKIYQILKSRMPNKLKIATLLDKTSRRKCDIQVDYVGIEIPDIFVVGYGLDYAQKHRTLPYLGKVVEDK
ncbi:hypoxanthine phosphoribosyltransferase [Mycoplasma sp. Mirounga ES2805-ORL]|uniref:hypoxanthine phosphoribosyltransferase n=1 Tax=Mycoplasma sp. Mirounga ES2805-ORL TaxID=754514 RepID=UPI00197B5B84|nr:hypoxanthine phosphoribosyltransferase [Mycoplasma sp. Mirounga ES2805-ORL]QSF13462.1 hypoxanthine phosphoribosyltransferase [Mycoplasma sp. Mirounga ES2805-ORL]